MSEQEVCPQKRTDLGYCCNFSGPVGFGICLFQAASCCTATACFTAAATRFDSGSSCRKRWEEGPAGPKEGTAELLHFKLLLKLENAGPFSCKLPLRLKSDSLGDDQRKLERILCRFPHSGHSLFTSKAVSQPYCVRISALSMWVCFGFTRTVRHNSVHTVTHNRLRLSGREEGKDRNVIKVSLSWGKHHNCPLMSLQVALLVSVEWCGRERKAGVQSWIGSLLPTRRKVVGKLRL